MHSPIIFAFAGITLAQAMSLELLETHSFPGDGWVDIGQAAGLPGSDTIVLAMGLQQPEDQDSVPALGYLQPENGELRLDTLSGRMWQVPRLAIATDGAIHLGAAIRTGVDSTGVWFIERTRAGAPLRDTAIVDSGYALSLRGLHADAGGNLLVAIERNKLRANSSDDRSILRLMKVRAGYRTIESRDRSIDKGSERVNAMALDSEGGIGLACGHVPYAGYGWALFIRSDSSLSSACYRNEVLKSYRGDATLTALLSPSEGESDGFLAAGISSDIRFVSTTSLLRVGCGEAASLASFDGFGPTVGLERLGGHYVLASAGEILLLDSAFAIHQRVAFEGRIGGLAVHGGRLLAWGKDGGGRPVLARYALVGTAALRTRRARGRTPRELSYTVDGRRMIVKGRQVRVGRSGR